MEQCTFKQIEQGEWECEMFGSGRDLVWTPNKGNEPNWFWRQMQYLCFGNKWIKTTNKEPESLDDAEDRQW